MYRFSRYLSESASHSVSTTGRCRDTRNTPEPIAAGSLVLVLICCAIFTAEPFCDGVRARCSSRSFMHIHILGICGTFMGSLAYLAKELGHRFTSSYANFYAT